MDDDKALLDAIGEASALLPGLTAFLRRNRAALSQKWSGRAIKGEWDARAAAMQSRFPRLTGEVLRCSWARVRSEASKSGKSSASPAAAPVSGFGVARPRA